MHEAAPINKPSLADTFFHHLLHMPAWHKYVLLGAIALAAVGTVGHVKQFIKGGATATAPGTSGSTPQSNFASADNSTDPAAPDANAPPWYLSPRFLSTGGSVLAGFIIGWALRVFVKTTLLTGLGITALIGGLSYFHVMNVDLTSVQQHYHTDMGWLTDQASRLKNIAIAHLPVHAGGIFGMFMGFRRPKV
jgi:uncharacterized membrane protein (Fun14 family)